MNIENIMCERNQPRKLHIVRFQFHEMSKNGKLPDIGCRLLVASGGGALGDGKELLMGMEFLFGGMKMF